MSAARPDTVYPEFAIEVAGLSKTYAGNQGRPPTEALIDVHMNVPRGSMFALLGPNGAGKSTLINILAGLVVRSGGSARVWGHDIETEMRAARRAIGVVPQELNIDPFFTPAELLDLQAGLYGVPRAERRTAEVLAAVGLSDKADAYARSLSGGMRRRLLVAKAMVHSPPILVLDEPTAGVDVELRLQLWQQVRALNAKGVTVLLTTHYLEEAEELCDTIAIINHGRLICCEDKPSLMRRVDSKEIRITVEGGVAAVPDPLRHLHAEIDAHQRLVVHYAPSQTQAGEIIAAVQAEGLCITDLSTSETELEDVFLTLTREPPGDPAQADSDAKPGAETPAGPTRRAGAGGR